MMTDPVQTQIDKLARTVKDLVAENVQMMKRIYASEPPADRAVTVTEDTHAAIGEALHRHLELPNMDTASYDRMIADIAEAALRAAVRGEDDK